MSVENKWEHIRAIAITFFCIAGLVTCEGTNQYSKIRIGEAEARKAEAEADATKARLALEKLKKEQGE